MEIIKRAATTGGGDWTPRLADVWAVVTACVGAILVALGGPDAALVTLLYFIAADYVSGLMKAIVQHNVSSSIAVKGLCRKFGLLMVVFLGARLDEWLGPNAFIRLFFCVAFIVSEGVSIAENLSVVGVPIPPWIITRLRVFQQMIAEGKWPFAVPGMPAGKPPGGPLGGAGATP
jgi:toxin secretion/phage lysis holin